jgi:hypothetical protein
MLHSSVANFEYFCFFQGHDVGGTRLARKERHFAKESALA